MTPFNDLVIKCVCTSARVCVLGRLTYTSRFDSNHDPRLTFRFISRLLIILRFAIQYHDYFDFPKKLHSFLII